VVAKAGNETTITGVDDLRGHSVGVNLGSNFEQLLRDLPYADEIDIRTYESNIEQDTALGRVDVFVMAVSLRRRSSRKARCRLPLPGNRSARSATPCRFAKTKPASRCATGSMRR